MCFFVQYFNQSRQSAKSINIAKGTTDPRVGCYDQIKNKKKEPLLNIHSLYHITQTLLALHGIEEGKILVKLQLGFSIAKGENYF